MKPPNLLVIHTDQQSWWTLGAYGGTLVDTPHIDRLAAGGVLCTSFFANSAVCTPSRGCLLTGRYPHCHGAHTNNLPLNRDEVTFAQVLREQGYRTGYVGKWHLDGDRRPGWVHPERAMGFADARYMFNRGHWKKIESADVGDVGDMEPIVSPYREIGDEHTYATDWLTDRTIELVEQGGAEPFCHMLSIPDPHTPFTVRAPYDTMYRPEDMPLPDTLFEAGLPDWAATARRQGDYYTEDREARRAQLRRHKAQYCGMVKLIDDSVGRILEALTATGQLEDTLVVFTSDHGEYMGEHGLMYKNQLYETAHRVPLILHWPAGLQPGTVVERVLAMVDFQPTILGLLGAPSSGREQGRDASALLRGQDVDWVDEAFIHHSGFARAGVFTDRYQLAYVRHAEPVLFDRRHDPDQVRNLFGDPAHRGAVEELTARIVDHHLALDSPASGWLTTATGAS